MQEAATRIVSALSVADRVALVPFASTAQKIADQGKFMYPATSDNIDVLVQAIAELEAIGETNFYDAFTAAFEILEDTIEQE